MNKSLTSQWSLIIKNNQQFLLYLCKKIVQHVCRKSNRNYG